MDQKRRELREEYQILLQVWSDGVSQYHQMVYTYLTALSVLAVAVAMLLQVAGEPPGTDEPRSSFLYLLAFVVSCAGIFLCVQMYVAAGRKTAENALLERHLRELEGRKGGLTARPYFDKRHEFLEKREGIGFSPSVDPEFTPNVAVRLHRKPWAKRMRGLPLTFGIVYFLLAVFSLWQGRSSCLSVGDWRMVSACALPLGAWVSLCFPAAPEERPTSLLREVLTAVRSAISDFLRMVAILVALIFAFLLWWWPGDKGLATACLIIALLLTGWITTDFLMAWRESAAAKRKGEEE